MVTKTRRNWLNENLKRGDRKQISSTTGVKYYKVVDVLLGRFVGPDGENILNAAEKIVTNRIKEIKKEMRVYSKKSKEPTT